VTVTAVNAGVAATVLVLVAVLALVVKPPAPPGIAAFAPQASKPITKAPPGQAAQFGNGAGACGAGQTCATTTPTPSARPGASGAPIATPSPTALKGAVPPGLQCYEWPDGSVTQTFDPQSPPCVSRWDDSKGNGGATSPGVSAREIRVALPVVSANSTWPTIKPVVDFFNTRFQMYGRTITIVPVVSQQADGNLTGKWNDPELQKADAAQIAASKVFATLDFMDPIPEAATVPVFLDAMQKAKIISVNGGEVSPFETAAGLAKRAPYAWSYYPTIDRLLASTANMVCRQLVGKPAAHSTDASVRGKTRKFALVLPTDERTGGPIPGLSDLLATLDGCGVHNPKVVRHSRDNQNVASNTAAMQQLKSDGVTSVIYLPWGGNGNQNSALLQAQQVSYFPEWVLLGVYNYNTAYMLRDPAAETGGAFGVGIWNKHAQLSLEPFHQAIVAAGGDPAQAGILSTARTLYQELMLLASGIQAAGPQLTPESFARGLHEAAFPNPGAGAAPFFQGTVGFEGGDPVMVKDYTAFWLDTRTTGAAATNSKANNEEKAFCMVGRGLRWRADEWPREDRFYEPGVCR
jgi:hypothetical protein